MTYRDCLRSGRDSNSRPSTPLGKCLEVILLYFVIMTFSYYPFLILYYSNWGCKCGCNFTKSSHRGPKITKGEQFLPSPCGSLNSVERGTFNDPKTNPILCSRNKYYLFTLYSYFFLSTY